MKKKEPKQWDERQTAIRNVAYKHGLFVLAALVLVDTIFRDDGTPWAQGKTNHLVYLAVVVAFVGIEFAIRGVYYGRLEGPKIVLIAMLLWMVCWSLALLFRISDMRHLGETITENGVLLLHGSYVITDCILIFMAVCYVVRASVDIFKDRRQNREKQSK